MAKPTIKVPTKSGLQKMKKDALIEKIETLQKSNSEINNKFQKARSTEQTQGRQILKLDKTIEQLKDENKALRQKVHLAEAENTDLKFDLGVKTSSLDNLRNSIYGFANLSWWTRSFMSSTTVRKLIYDK
jgi:chromosome segregation ATPase